MNKINLKGITSEAVTGVFVLAVALVNAILQMLGINILPIEDMEISAIVSGVFLVLTALWNTWKNRNATTPAQLAQNIADALREGEIVEEDVKALLNKVRK